MKLLDFSPRPGAHNPLPDTYEPSTDLTTFGFTEQFLIWATRAAQTGSDRGVSQVKLASAFAAVDAPDAFPLLREFLSTLEKEFGRPLTAPCFKWRSLMADEARVLNLLVHFQKLIMGSAKPMASLPIALQRTGQMLALSLHSAGLTLRPGSSTVSHKDWSDAMPMVH